MQIKVEIKNLNKMMSALARSPRILRSRLDTAIKKSIIKIRDEAAVRTPVDTGRLRGSYEQRFGSLYGETGPNTKYALFVHEGTRYMTGRPYLAQGMEAAKVNKIFEEEYKGGLEDIAREVR